MCASILHGMGNDMNETGKTSFTKPYSELTGKGQKSWISDSISNRAHVDEPAIDASVISTSSIPASHASTKLDEYKKRLLDLSMRNNLLNYSSKKLGTLRACAPDAQTLYQQVVIDECPMTLIESSLNSEAQHDGDLWPIETERTFSELTKCLKTLEKNARESIEEQGINTLYLAFGMLKWIEEKNTERSAPLILVPVRLTHASANSSYVLHVRDDDPVVNPALNYFLEQKYGFVLPSFDKEDQLRQFFIAVRETVHDQNDWEVTNEVVLSTFKFQKLSMYHDLEARSDEILSHPIVKAIMGDRTSLSGSLNTENPDELKPTDTFQVVDADASQQAAILAAHQGESFVLQGPPGTGKSQTITNIIADCLGSGKKVLFVSEKKAALDVVYHRLAQVKLEEFCLVLHANNLGKNEVLGQLSHTLNLDLETPRMSSAASARLKTLASLRDRLNSYAKAIYEPLDPFGISPYEAIGVVVRYEREDVPYLLCRYEGIERLTPEQMTSLTEAIRKYAYVVSELECPPNSNPWNGFGIKCLNHVECDELVKTLNQASSGARDLLELWHRERELGLEVSPTYTSIKASLDLLDDLGNMPVVPSKVLTSSSTHVKRLVSEYLESDDRIQSSCDDLLRELSELAIFEPKLELLCDPEAFSEIGYAETLSETLRSKLNVFPIYATWLKTSEAEFDEAFVELKDCLSSCEALKAELLSNYHVEVLDLDFTEMEKRFKTDYRSAFKRMFGQHKEDIKTLTGLRRSYDQVDDNEAIHVLGMLHELQSKERILKDMPQNFERLFGDCYRGARTDLSLIENKREIFVKAKACLELLDNHACLLSQFIERGHQCETAFGDQFDSSDRGWANDIIDATDSFEKLESKYAKLENGVGLGSVTSRLTDEHTSTTATAIADDLRSVLKYRTPFFNQAATAVPNIDFYKLSLNQLVLKIESATNLGTDSLWHYVSYVQVKKTCNDLGLSDFIATLSREQWAFDPEYLEQYGDILRHTIYKMWLDTVARKKRPELGEFSATEHEQRIAEFKNLDLEQLAIDQARVCRELFPHIPSARMRENGGDEFGILLREINKKKHTRSIRKLFADIPHAVLALKPCLMMSPLSVSTYLESAYFQFDTVIFDEASQVRTEDALGVISRGKQVIIAGDSKQLPPTNFFAANTEEEGEVEDDEYYDQAGLFDSVLDEAALLNTISLKWHYRSRDESLITYSNDKIYDGGLFTFPSSCLSKNDMGVEFIYVENGLYEGSSKGNRIEAECVADLVMEHFKTYGNERSLGVIALSENQSRLIDDVITSRVMANPEMECFLDSEIDEPFFVKNLENVQGDERETIILCIGYAKGPSGKLSHNFGPMNKEGGERRLNVAITRARNNLKLVTSIDPSEIDLNKVSYEGPKLLKGYLTYAKAGSNYVSPSNSRNYGYVEKDSFLEVVKNVLEEAGFKVDESVGRSDCKIDLAVRDPEQNDRYCIGIVCDGDSYHAAVTARDRDRLRTQVLNGMEWNLYHVWACEWMQDAARQEELLIEKVKEYCS